MAEFAGEHVVCIISGSPGATEHHLMTQKAHPQHRNEAWNRIPVAQYFHNMFHQHGTKYMADKYPAVKEWLLKNGWEFDAVSKKWRHFGD